MTKISTLKAGVIATSKVKAKPTTGNQKTKQPEAALSDFSAAAERFMAAAQSDATKRAYASDIKHFLANGGAIPSSPAVLAEYLASSAEKLSVATLVRRLTAIHKAHLEISAKSPAQRDRKSVV